MGGDEVFQNAQPLAEVGGDGAFDNFATGLGHEAAHSCELFDLLLIASRSGVDHDEHGIEFLAALVVFEGLNHHVSDGVSRVSPNVDDLVVAFAIGDDA